MTNIDWDKMREEVAMAIKDFHDENATTAWEMLHVHDARRIASGVIAVFKKYVGE